MCSTAETTPLSFGIVADNSRLLCYSIKVHDCKNYNRHCSSHDKGLWSSGYDIALTQRRPPVQIRPSPLYENSLGSQVRPALTIKYSTAIRHPLLFEDRGFLAQIIVMEGRDKYAGCSRQPTTLVVGGCHNSQEIYFNV